MTSATGNVATAVALALHGSTVWVAWHQSGDNDLYVGRCDQAVSDCLQTANWQRGVLGVGATAGGQDPGIAYHDIGLDVRPGRVVVHMFSDADPSPGSVSQREHLLVCDQADPADCMQPTAWSAILNGTFQSAAAHLFADARRVSIFYMEDSQRRVSVRTCVTNCTDPASWSLGTLLQDSSLSAFLIRAAGFAGGSASLVLIGPNQPWEIWRPLLYPTRTDTPRLTVGGVEMSWALDELATGYRVEVTAAALETAIDIADPGIGDFAIALQGGVPYTLTVRSRSAVGTSDRGRRYLVEAPTAVLTLPGAVNNAPADYEEIVRAAVSGEAVSRLGRDTSGRVAVEYCPMACDNGANWSGGAIWTPPTPGEICYWDLTTATSGVFWAAVRVTFPTAGTSMIWGLSCASNCAQATSWSAGPIRLSSGDAPGLKLSLAADQRQLWLGHIIDQQPVGSTEHYGNFELMSCALATDCTRDANWTTMTLEPPGDPWATESDIALAVTSQAVYAAVVNIAGIPYDEFVERYKAGELKRERQLGKLANLSLQYRTSVKTLKTRAASQFGIQLSEYEAKHIKDTYQMTYPKVREYHRSAIYRAQQHGYAETAGGCRVTISDWSDSWRAEQTAINYPIQGTGADQKYLALRLLKPLIQQYSASFAWDLHDGMFFFVPEKRAKDFAHNAKTVVDGIDYRHEGFNLDLKYPVDIAAGPRWGEMEDVT